MEEIQKEFGTRKKKSFVEEETIRQRSKNVQKNH
jgi:hypothetical protein